MNAMPKKMSETKLLVDHPARLIGEHGSSKKRPAPDVYSIPEIHHRAETITPVLGAILDYRPRPHWRTE